MRVIRGFITSLQVAVATFTLVSVTAIGAAHAGLSAVRHPSTPGSHYLRAVQEISILNGNTAQRGPAVWEKGPFDQAKWERVPALSAGDLQASFELARDEKPLKDDEQRARRASWLYPEDGCFVRAVVAADIFAKSTSLKPAKIFAFGSLSVKSENTPGGEVQWWYHVAAIAKVVDPKTKAESFYVYDPAMQAKAPMEVKAWLAAMNDPDVDIAICSGDAYDPDSDCENGIQGIYSRAQQEAPGYLSSEWYQLESMGRDPAKELGDFPPWLKVNKAI